MESGLLGIFHSCFVFDILGLSWLPRFLYCVEMVLLFPDRTVVLIRVPQRYPNWILAAVTAGSLIRTTAYIVLCPCSETMRCETNGAETLVPAMI